MLKYKVIRPNDIVYVLLLRHKVTNKYSFVNLTKEHICPCQFNTVEEALNALSSARLLKQIHETIQCRKKIQKR